jgi:hypothetical protein
MRYPIAVLLRRAEIENRLVVTSAVREFMNRRGLDIAPGQLTTWSYFGNHDGIPDLDQFVAFSYDLMKGRIQSQGAAKMQLWLGVQPQLDDEFDFAGRLLDDTGEEATRLLEQWELVLLERPFPRFELLLWDASYQKSDWYQLHLNFCERTLGDEVVHAVWNGFFAGELNEACKKENE